MSRVRVHLAVAVLVVLGASPPSTARADWWGWAGICFPLQIDNVWVGATPDAGHIEPDVLVREGQLVKLSGHARRITVEGNCTVSETSLAYKWGLTFRPPGGLATPADDDLQSPGSLSPRFTANKGVYVVTLSAGDRTARLRVEATNGWVNIGPDTRTPPTPDQMGVGRVNGIAWDPVDPHVMYAATARGGIWRSDDAASSWWPMTDQKGFPATLSTSRVVVGPGRRVFAGTGDPDPNGDFQAIADGMFISDDGGVTWRQVNAALCAGVTDPPTGTITRILIDPRSWQAPETVYVAASTGVFRSRDGGNCWTNLLPREAWDIALVRSTSDFGPTVRPWRSLLAAVPATPSAIADLVIQLDDALDPGPAWTWRTLPAEASAAPALQGVVSKIALAVSQQSVYAAVAHPDDVAFFRYDVGGGWKRRPDPGFTSQTGYDLALAVSPDDADDVYVGLVDVARSTDGAESWFGFNPGASIYSDQHTFAFDPTSSARLFSGNDGGISAIELLPSSDAAQQAAAGPPWIPRNEGMMTSLVEALSLAHAPSGRTGAAGGRLDAGTASRVKGRVWKLVGGGDGNVSGFDAEKTDLIYRNNNTSVEGHQWDFNRETGGLTALAANFWTDPLRSGVMLAVGVDGRSVFSLHYARDMDVASAPAWTCIDPTPADDDDGVRALDFLSTEGGYVVGTARGAFFRLDVPRDPPAVGLCQGTSAATVTALWTAPAALPDPGATLAVGQVLGLSLDALTANSFYATLGRFDEWRVVRVFRNRKGGWTGEPIAGVPGQPGSFPAELRGCAACSAYMIAAPIAADPQTKGVVYVGTEAGLVVGTQAPDGRWSWVRDPDVPLGWVNDLRVRRGKLGAQGIVRASTYGRSVWERSRFGRTIGRLPPIPPPTPVWLFDPLLEQTFRPWNALAIHYSYDGAAGPVAEVRATLLRGGRPARGFRLERAMVGPGEGIVQLGVFYPGRDVGRAVTTDAVRIQMLARGGRVLSRLDVPTSARWRRQDLRSVAVRSDAAGRDGPPIQVTPRVLISEGGRTQDATEGAVLVPAGARVTVRLPAVVETRDGEARFAGWLEAPKGTPPPPVVTLTAAEDITLLARYRLPAGERKSRRLPATSP
jgi:hypothetical protein